MTFELWAAEKGFELASLSPKAVSNLVSAYQAELPVATIAPPLGTTPPSSPTPAAPPAGSSSGSGANQTPYEAELAAARRESDRRRIIDESIAEAFRKVLNFPDRVERLELLRNAAIEGGWSIEKFQLEMMKEQNHVGPIISVAQGREINSNILEAALCLSQKLPGAEAHYSAQTLDMASSGRFKRGIGLREFLRIAAQQNSHYRGSDNDIAALLRAAFPGGGGGSGGLQSADGPSTIAVSGILSNVANKFLRPAFEGVESMWRKISTRRPVSDFKSISSYSLVGDNVFEELSPGGKIKDGSLGEVSYSNQAHSFAKLLGLDYRDIRNDDLGALTGAGRRLGRGGALKFNAVFWAEWLDDASFFLTDKSANNYDDGATDSVLSFAGLTNADLIFRAQTNPTGPADSGTTPLGSIPRILLVPTALPTTAWNLMNSQYVNLVTATTPTQGTENPWRGQFEPVDSTYLGAANTNGSDTAWYLLASPDDISGIEAVFLDGIEIPLIEVGQPDFDQLGIAMRGSFHFGVTKQEKKCGVKLKGAA